MTTENNEAPDLKLVEATEAVSAQLFSLKDALAGRTYPEKEVPVFLDEALAWKLKQVNDAVDRNPQDAELEAERSRITSQFQELALVFHLRGVPRHVRAAIETKIDKKYPPKVGMLGNELPFPERDDALTFEFWKVYVQSITNAANQVSLPSEDDLEEFRRMAPQASIDAVTGGIRSLIDDSEKGYELGVQELSFLSQPSPGA